MMALCLCPSCRTLSAHQEELRVLANQMLNHKMLSITYNPNFPHKTFAQGFKVSASLKPTRKRISAKFINPDEVFIKVDDIKIPKQEIRDKLNTCNCSIPGKDIAGTGKCGYCHKTVANPLDVSMDKLLVACKEAFKYLNQPHKSELGNVEVINLLHNTITEAEKKIGGI
jgi:hypothetical protein